MNQKILIANWKMNPQTLKEAQELFVAVKPGTNVTAVVCPPFVYIEELSRFLQGHPVSTPFVYIEELSRFLQGHPVSKNDKISLGAQDVHWQDSGAFTGEISVKQLSEFGVKYVLVGHSERRALGETDEMINKKLLAALKHNIKPILLVGEKERGEYRQDVLIDQLSRDLTGVTVSQLSNLLICYEPVWAISSNSGGISDTPESALEAIKMIEDILVKLFPKTGSEIPILYGGSVNVSNVGEFLKHDEIAGAVVGSVSLKAEEFNKILEIIASL